MKPRDREGRDLAAVGMALAIALLCSTMLRTVAAEVNNTAGRMWPFSLAHCHVAASPGCDPQPGRVLASSGRPAR